MLLFLLYITMAQIIRKYSTGKPIKLEQDKLFQRDGFGSYKREDIANNLAKGLEQFIADERMNEKDAQMFRQIVGQAIQGTKNGQFTKMDSAGIHNNMNLNSSGVTEGKKFLGINVGGQRAFDKSAATNDGKNNALNALNRFYTKTLDQMSVYDYDKELKDYEAKNPKTKYNANKYLTDAISKKWYGGNDIDWENFNTKRTEQERIALLTEILNNADYNELFNKHDWSSSNIKSSQDLSALYKALGTKLADGTLNNDDYNAFAAIGGTNLDDFIKGKVVPQEVPTIKGRVGTLDGTWDNPDYERTIDKDGKYHIYKKGTGEEVSGIITGNVFEGTGNKYAFDGNIYNDSNLPEKYQQDIIRARQAQLANYTQLDENNPFTKLLKDRGYNYITNLSQYASDLGNNSLFGVYANPADVNDKMGYYLRDNKTKKAINGRIEYNNTLGQYQFIGNDGKVTNLGAYNSNGSATNNDVQFVNYNDTSANNLNALMQAWMNNSDLKNPASTAYKMVQNSLSKWIASENNPFVNQDGTYSWVQGDYYMNVRQTPDGKWEWVFNDKFNNPEQKNQDKNQVVQEALDKVHSMGYHKQGGILSAQLGIKFDNKVTPTSIELPEASEEQKQKAKLVKESFNKQQNINLGTLMSDKPFGEDKKVINAGGVLKDADKMKLKAALVDLAGTGLGFIPGMNIASAVTGVGASAMNAYADLQDGFHWGDVGNLAMNLGMDALSIIPIGKSAKALRALGTISKSAPLIMTSLNAIGLADPDLRASYEQTLNKVKNIRSIDAIKSLNTGDIQNINAMLGLVLGTKNLAKSHKGKWNTNTTASGKRRVTAMIDGKQQSLELDEAFFQNTKGKNQVQELKSKFAEQYNKQNKLEGDKAIKPENVAVDTKYFGRRPQSEKVAGTKSDGNWVTNNMIGRYFLGYEDPSVPRGLDEILLNTKLFKRSAKTKDTQRDQKAQTIQNNRLNYLKSLDSNKQLTPKDIKIINAQRKSKGKEPLTQQEIDIINNRRKQTQDTPSLNQRLANYKKKKAEWTVEDAQKELAEINRQQKLAVPVWGSEIETPKDAKNIIKVFNAIPTVRQSSAPITNPPAIIPKQSLNLSDVVQKSYQAPKFTGIQEGIERATKQRIARDIHNTKIQRSVQQNTETVARKQAEKAKRNVDKAITMATIPSYKGALQGAPYKSKQTMYNKLFNQRYYDMQDAIRNKALPHKKSNNKKKTSKDNRVKRREWGGLLFKDGGLIPKFQSPAGPIRMQAKTKNYFDRNTGLSGYNLGADIDEFLKHGTAEDYVIGFNGREDNYDALVKASKGTYGNRSYISNPLATTVQSAMLTYNPGFDKYIRQNIQGYGVTEGQGTGTDKYFGDRTWERTLGRNITAEQAKYFNDTYLKQRGIEMYDKGDGGYRLRLIPASNQVTTGLKNDTQKNGTEVEDSVVGNSSKTDRPKGFLRNVKINPENLSAFGRMLGGIYTNNKAAEIYKQGLKPTLLETFENTVPIQGNYLSIYNANQIADNLNNLAAKARTSDAALQLAGELEANNRAGQISLQGGLPDAEMFYKTRMLGQQESDAAKARRIEVSNANRASINQIAAAKKQIDSAKITSNYQNVIAPYLMEKEHTIKQNKALANQLALENFTLNQSAKYKQELDDLKNTYANDETKLQEEVNKLDRKYKNIINTKKLEFLNNPYLVQFSKSGSKLSYADRAKLQRAKDFNKRLLSDNKQFHKNISESKKEHNKLIMNMSALTAALIKKGMRV